MELAYPIAYDIARRRDQPRRRSILGVQFSAEPSYALRDKEKQRIQVYEETHDCSLPHLDSVDSRDELASLLQELLDCAEDDGSHPLDGDYGRLVEEGTLSEVFPTTWAYLSKMVPVTHPEFVDDVPDASLECILRCPVDKWIQEEHTIAMYGNNTMFLYLDAPRSFDDSLQRYAAMKTAQYDMQPQYVKRLVHEYQHHLQSQGWFSNQSALPSSIGKSSKLGHWMISLFFHVPGATSLVSDDTLTSMKKLRRREYFRSPEEYEARLAEYVYLRTQGHDSNEAMQNLDLPITLDDTQHKRREAKHGLETGDIDEATAEDKIAFCNTVEEELEAFKDYGDTLVERLLDDQSDLWDEDAYQEIRS